MSTLDVLAEKNLIKKEDIEKITSQSKTDDDLISNLSKYGVSEDEYMEARGEYFGMPFLDLNGVSVPYEVLKYVPEDSAKFYQIVPVSLNDNVLEIGVVDPESPETQNALNFISSRVDLPIKARLIRSKDFGRLLAEYNGLSGEVTQALSDLEKDLAEKGQFEKTVKKDGNTKIIEEAPVTKIVATILHYATDGNASDIHIEPIVDKVRVRFRVDGALSTSLVLPMRVHQAVVARIKILSNMRLDEKRKPQDGRFSARIEGRKIDFRVSTFPTYFGEKIVMRILDRGRGIKKLEEMGFSKEDLKKVKEAIKRPYGLILISGPTGSGKSTTLYSMLQELDFESDNILSLEDPVEYNIEGMNQSQIKPEIGYTFATGLRTTLRQDPDIIMVGEIRDKETAQLAVQAALTGHLVLSTIHTNNAAGVIPRLIDMGIDPYMIAPTLILAMAQRLVSLLHPPGKEVKIEGSVKILIDNMMKDIPESERQKIQIPDKIYEAKPSPDCPKGTRGRTAVFEILEMNNELEEVILKNATENAIMDVVRKQGMLTMKEDALIKAFKGEIPFEEVNKL